MKKLAITVIALVVAGSFLFGCKKSAEDRLLNHLEQAISILESNKDNPDKAAEEIKKYTDANKGDMEAIKKELEEMEKTLSDDDKKKKGEEMMKKMGPIMERAMKLMTGDSKLQGSEAVQKAMGDFFPMR